MSKNWAIAFIVLIVILFAASGFFGYMSINLNGKIDTLDEDTQAFKNDTASQFNTTMNTIASVNSNLTDFISETDDTFNTVQSDITGLDSDLTTFKTDTAGRFGTVESSITGINTGISGLNTDLTSLTSQYSESTMNVRQIYDNVINSVCMITDGTSTGSGFVYSAEGLIVTCWHVVDGMTNIDVVLHDGTVVRAALVGSDRFGDVAVLEIPGHSDLTPLPLADSSALVAGEPVVIVGNPFGIFETITYGVISRTKGIIFSSVCGCWISNMIQYDAAQNGGNSGGPVFNKEGEVIGIAAYSRSSSEGIHYAVSSNKINRVVQAIIDSGSFDHAMLPGNWSLDDLTPEIAIERGLDSAFGVIFIQAQGMADVQVDDIIIAVDGIAVKDGADLFSYIAEFKSPGDTITLTLIRGSGAQITQIEVSLTLLKGWIT